MMNNCVPIKKHYRCGKCKKRFSKVVGDCISLNDLYPKCPYCGSEEITFCEEANPVAETIDEVIGTFKKIFK